VFGNALKWSLEARKSNQTSVEPEIGPKAEAEVRVRARSKVDGGEEGEDECADKA
jgi:hypothetical protein